MASIVRTAEEIARVEDWARESQSAGKSHFFGMSYEDGLLAMLDWLTGVTDDAPDAD